MLTIVDMPFIQVLMICLSRTISIVMLKLNINGIPKESMRKTGIDCSYFELKKYVIRGSAYKK
jgi:hypothetical protein